MPELRAHLDDANLEAHSFESYHRHVAAFYQENQLEGTPEEILARAERAWRASSTLLWHEPLTPWAALLAQRPWRTLVVCTAPSNFPEAARNLLKEMGVMAAWWGGDHPWFARWEGKVRGSALSASSLQGNSRVVLVFIVGPQTSYSSHREWSSRTTSQRNIMQESGGLVTEVNFCAVAEAEVRASIGL